MKEILISLLFAGILRGMWSLIEYNREGGTAKVISIMEYRNRRAMNQFCHNI